MWRCGILLFALLFAGGIGATSSGFIGFALRELTAIGQDSATQWMLVFCLAIYFVSFLILELRTRVTLPTFAPQIRMCGWQRSFCCRFFVMRGIRDGIALHSNAHAAGRHCFGKSDGNLGAVAE